MMGGEESTLDELDLTIAWNRRAAAASPQEPLLGPRPIFEPEGSKEQFVLYLGEHIPQGTRDRIKRALKREFSEDDGSAEGFIAGVFGTHRAYDYEDVVTIVKAALAPASPPKAEGEAVRPNDENYCLVCEKAGHRTEECWSTHGYNTPRDKEIFRLAQLAHLALAAPVQPAEGAEPSREVHRSLAFALMRAKVPLLDELEPLMPYRTVADVRLAISEAIGFEWEPGELQPVNADDLMRIAAALASQPADKDGARYRWLRAAWLAVDGTDREEEWTVIMNVLTEQEMDAAVDAAMSTGTQKEEEA